MPRIRRSPDSQTAERPLAETTRSGDPLLSRSAISKRAAPGGTRRRRVVPAGEVLLFPCVAHEGCAANGPLPVERHEIDETIAVDVRHGDSDQPLRRARIDDRGELASLPVLEHVQVALRVEQHRIGIAIPIEVRPREASQIRNACKRLRLAPRPVAVVAQDDGRPAFFADDDVEIAVHFDVGGPGAHAVGGHRLVGACSRRRGVTKRSVGLLEQQADAAGAGEHEIHPEVAVPVDRQRRAAERLRRTAASRKRESRSRSADSAQSRIVCGVDDRRARAFGRKRQYRYGWRALLGAEQLRSRTTKRYRAATVSKWMAAGR